MKPIGIALLIVCTGSTLARGEQNRLACSITSLGLFKNGLALVERTVEVPGSGTFRVEDLPVPVHGTFWVESDAKVAVRMTEQSVEVPAAQVPRIDFQQDLEGREVEVYFTNGQIAPVTGTVVSIRPREGGQMWNQDYQQPQYGYGWYPYRSRSSAVAAGRNSGEAMLILQSEQGRSYIRPSMIAYLRVKDDGGGTVSIRRPIMLLDVQADRKRAVTLVIRYLTKGMAWAPSYQVDITDPHRLLLRQKAVVKNELEPVRDVEIRLISGFPSMRFANVCSPLSLTTTWSQFFEQLNRRYSQAHPATSNVVSQQAIAFNVAGPEGGFDLSATPSGEGVDLHYQAIGRYTLDAGDSLMVETASARAEYERIVEWIVPDTRDARGRYLRDPQREAEPEKYQDAVWDAVRFRNPLEFPMTTAPAMVVSSGRFNGQQMSYWANVGEETTLHVTKALSVRTRSTEHEIEGTREIVYIGGDDFRKTTVEGELSANNHRKEPITLVIRRRFSGELVSAKGNPHKMLLEEGAWAVNKRNQLTWTVELAPGEEVTYDYRYTVLVDN